MCHASLANESKCCLQRTLLALSVFDYWVPSCLLRDSLPFILSPTCLSKGQAETGTPANQRFCFCDFHWTAQTAKLWKPSCSVCSASSCTPRPGRCCSRCPPHLATCRMGWQVTALLQIVCRANLTVMKRALVLHSCFASSSLKLFRHRLTLLCSRAQAQARHTAGAGGYCIRLGVAGGKRNTRKMRECLLRAQILTLLAMSLREIWSSQHKIVGAEILHRVVAKGPGPSARTFCRPLVVLRDF